jgi:hypothetical protein
LRQRFEQEAKAISSLIIRIFPHCMTSAIKTAPTSWSWNISKENIAAKVCSLLIENHSSKESLLAFMH